MHIIKGHFNTESIERSKQKENKGHSINESELSNNKYINFDKLDDFLNQKNYFTDVLAYGESKTGLTRRYLFLGSAALFGLILIVGYLSRFTVSLIGFLYPAYASVKAIETIQKEDDLKWLTYWVVYSSFNMVEFFSDIILSSWFPFYFTFKCLFLIWCMAPISWNGSYFVYHKFIAPFFLKHSDEADILITEATKVANEIYGHVESEVKKVSVEALKED